LHFGKTEIFLPTGLDRANQIDPAQQIRFYAQIRKGRREATEAWISQSSWDWTENSPSGQISRPLRRSSKNEGGRRPFIVGERRITLLFSRPEIYRREAR
jgi:hypothetical protein